MIPPDPYDYLEVPILPDEDRHAKAGGYEVHGWVFVGFRPEPPTLLFRKKKEVIEA